MLWASPVLAAVLSGARRSAAAVRGAGPATRCRRCGVLFVAPLSSLDGLTELALKATPLLLCAIGIAIGCRADVWNIGAEGQFTIGAIAGGGVALAFGGARRLAGCCRRCCWPASRGGVVWAGIPALLNTRFNAHEILTTLMLTYVAIQLLGYLVHGPWKDPEGFSFPQTQAVRAGRDAADADRGHAAACRRRCSRCWRCRWRGCCSAARCSGFRIRVVGARAGGGALCRVQPRRRGLVVPAAVAAGWPGWPASARSPGRIGQLTPVISPGYGFAAIIVAFLGRLQPGRHPVRLPADGAAVPGRRGAADVAASCRSRPPA